MEERRKLRLHDWAIILGMVAQLIMMSVMFFRWGQWTGTIEAKINNIVEQFQQLRDLPSRVAYLEGVHCKEYKIK